MTVPVTRYRYRAANIPTPWQRTSTNPVMGYAAAPGGAYRSGRGHRVPLDRQGDREDQERGRVCNQADDHLRR